MLGLVLPFFAYWGLDSIGLDITWPMYLARRRVAARHRDDDLGRGLPRAAPPGPPAGEPGSPYPPATAIIAAYLPNEAATIVETVESFLAQDYPGELQVVLAYNTPHDLPIEDELRAIAARDPRLVPFRVEHSHVEGAERQRRAGAPPTGEFVAVFDADHQPAPGAFARAWRWLSNGYDLVQGHCVVRNGDVSWVARTVAVEFEAIYAVSHPGRARLHDFGIFGGTNGFWRAGVLREIRMRGSMLTEDIDSSMRVVEEGGRIASDPRLISRELGPATLKALWNQRLRWAQGWFQVSMRHLWSGLRVARAQRAPEARPLLPAGLARDLPVALAADVPDRRLTGSSTDGDVDWLDPALRRHDDLHASAPARGRCSSPIAGGARRSARTSAGSCSTSSSRSLFFTEFKNVVARVAQIKQLTGERHWKVTPRG